MDIAAALASTIRERVHRCKVGLALDSLADMPDHDALVYAVERKDSAFSGNQLQEAFGKLNYDVSASLVLLHRRGRCACRGA